MSIASNLQATGVADVLVFLKPKAATKAASRRVGAAAAAAAAAGEGTPDPFAPAPSKALLKLFVDAPLAQDAALLEAMALGAAAPKRAGRGAGAAAASAADTTPPGPRWFDQLGLVLGTVDRKGLAALRARNDVQSIADAPALRMIKPVARADAQAAVGFSWGLKAMKVDQLRAQGLDGSGILIGHLDTGVDGTHPALAGAIAAFAEFDMLGRLVPGAPATDSDDHGTHTAGTIAARPVNGFQFGVAPGARLASAMVIEGGHVLARILAGINWTMAQRVRILSMSLGLPGSNAFFRPIVQRLRVRGILPVFAVGNEGPGTSRYPGNYSEAMSIGAHDNAFAVAGFSSSQRFVRLRDPVVPDLVGPGVDVVSCVPGGYKLMSGTSMATPHIAGLAALLMQARPAATMAKIERAIFKSCTLRPGMLASRANRGAPDGVVALSLL
ncbi:MAG: S8 family peptidase [Rubrivivax sp.]|jgi:subtilisin family serine protease|nr:S8 family serine peptidase [Rubrivivax sp.]